MDAGGSLLNRIRSHHGFTLAELLIVVAIIAVLVAIAIPVFNSQLEKSREATDLANVRSAYAEVMTAAITEDHGEAKFDGKTIYQSDGSYVAVVSPLKQQTKGWQSTMPIAIGGVTSDDKVHWKNEPEAGGKCTITYNPKDGSVTFDWGGTPTTQSYPFNTEITDFFESVLYKTPFWEKGDFKDTINCEWDSSCPNSTRVPEIKNVLGQYSNTLLQQEGCTWAFLGDGNRSAKDDQYLCWTSLDTNKVGGNQKIPVLVQRGDGKYYVAEITTQEKSIDNGTSYVAITSDKLKAYTKESSKKKREKALASGEAYGSLTEAYDAYLNALNSSKYDGVRN